VDLAGPFLLPPLLNQQSLFSIILHQSVILNNNLFLVQVHTVTLVVVVDGTTGLGTIYKLMLKKHLLPTHTATFHTLMVLLPPARPTHQLV